MVEKVRTDMNVIWAQPSGPNTAMVAIPCAVIGEVAESHGAIEQMYCLNSQTGKYEVISRSRGTPDLTTVDVEELMDLTASDLEKAFRRDCPVPIYINTQQCTPRMSFSGFDRVKILQDALLETETEGPMGNRETAELSMTTMALSIKAVEKAFKLDEYRKVTVEDQILRDIAHCGDPSCYGECGPNADICETLVAVADAVGVGTANVLYSTDGGDTWAATAADPFIADEDIASVVCFPINSTTWRWVVARGTTSAAPAPGEVAYSDDNGASWTLTELGSANGNFVLHGSAMFALDMYHIWVVDDQGDIWFSDDGAVSFTEQVTPNATALYGVYFMNSKEGVVVGGSGAANVMGITRDGGANWSLTTTIGPAATFVPWAVTMHDLNVIFIVGVTAGAAGQLWYTNDGGTNWTQRVLPTPTGMTSIDQLLDIERRDRYCMFVAGECQVGGVAYGGIWRTVNGGTDWEFWLSEALDATGAGFQALTTCHYNQAFAVGDVATTSAIYEVTD